MKITENVGFLQYNNPLNGRDISIHDLDYYFIPDLNGDFEETDYDTDNEYNDVINNER